ncbi:MAG TPA: PIG-L family deacetylase [Chthoniobacteraceae bacterium]|nr:PIG-L family deacetylase [Chthoniobacteraceae bacterium]
MNVLAAVAHPDDIEFMMAGTLLALREAGCRIHFWNLANGSCGTQSYSREEIIALREAEAAESAKLAGAIYHPPLFEDLGVFYDAPSLAKVAAVVREVAPDLILTHSPNDYMEDHEAVCRLVCMAAFSRGMTNFRSEPPQPVIGKPVRIYHALPHGLRDGLGRKVEADRYVEITPHLEKKAALLACHRTQKEWLDASQGMGAYLEEMQRLSAAMGEMSGSFTYAEAFRMHNHLGYCAPEFDPLVALLGARTVSGAS